MIRVPYLSREQIERDAAALLVEYEQARGVIVAPPIPIDDIVEKHLKLVVEFDDMHRLCGVPRPPGRTADILGAMYFDERRIVIDQSLDPDGNPLIEARYRFTLAHEGGGHWRLHRHLFAGEALDSSARELLAPVVCHGRFETVPVEWQANYYAACLLMPRKLVIGAWRRHFGSTRPFVFDRKLHVGAAERRRQHGLRPVAAVVRRAHQPACERAFDDIARALAPTFAVSIKAMRIRLETLGLLLRDADAWPHRQMAD